VPRPFLVVTARGPAWDHGRGRREQAGWDEHAAFMDRLVDEGTIALGGPLGDVDGEHVALLFLAEDEAAIQARMAQDPWAGRLLQVRDVQPWTLWLRGPGSPGS
jgi:uncharacterized protein YciI